MAASIVLNHWNMFKDEKEGQYKELKHILLNFTNWPYRFSSVSLLGLIFFKILYAY